MANYNLHATVIRPLPKGGDLYAPEASIKADERPDWMKRWERPACSSSPTKNGDGRIQYYNDKTKNPECQGRRKPAGWKGNELTVNADIIVLANPEIALLPNWVIALVAAGGLAAALSTAAGLLMAISSAVSHDLVKGVFAPNISEERAAGGQDLDGRCHRDFRLPRPESARICGRYRGAGLRYRGFLAVPRDHVGIFSKKMNKEGAIAGMLAGLFITLFYVFAHKGIFFIRGTDFLPMIGGANSFFGITPEAFGAVGALENFIVAFIVDKVTKEPPGTSSIWSKTSASRVAPRLWMVPTKLPVVAFSAGIYGGKSVFSSSGRHVGHCLS